LAVLKAGLKAALLVAESVDWLVWMLAEMKASLKAGWLALLRVEWKGMLKVEQTETVMAVHWAAWWVDL
jgi:hypothetical protein